MHVRFTELPVVDQERAVRFYTEKLGFRVAQDRQYQEGWRWITLEIPGSQTKILLSRKTAAKNNDGVPSLVLTVDDVFKSFHEFKDKGVVFTSEPAGAPWDESEVFAVFLDSEDNLVMLGSKAR